MFCFWAAGAEELVNAKNFCGRQNMTKTRKSKKSADATAEQVDDVVVDEAPIETTDVAVDAEAAKPTTSATTSSDAVVDELVDAAEPPPPYVTPKSEGYISSFAFYAVNRLIGLGYKRQLDMVRRLCAVLPRVVESSKLTAQALFGDVHF